MSEQFFEEGPANNLPTPLPHTESRFTETRVVCPRCHTATESLKAYKILVIHSITEEEWEKVVACPACMRKRLLNMIFRALPKSFIFFPIIASIYLCQWLLS